MTGPERCTYRQWRRETDTYGPPCDEPATFTEYTDEGRHEHPRCTKHYQPAGRGPFKGPEDL